MKTAYVDSSCVIAVALSEPGWKRIARRLGGFDVLHSANLLEAEVRSAMNREHLDGDDSLLLGSIRWIFPVETLSAEIVRVLDEGHLRGADLWHLACALHFAPDPSEISFLTLDTEQAGIARRLGFQE